MLKLSATLPKGIKNGLGVLSPDLVADPIRRHMIIAVVDCSATTTTTDTGETVPTARILRVEALVPADRVTAQRLIARAVERRTAAPTLPDGLEDDVVAVVHGDGYEPLP